MLREGRMQGSWTRAGLTAKARPSEERGLELRAAGEGRAGAAEVAELEVGFGEQWGATAELPV